MARITRRERLAVVVCVAALLGTLAYYGGYRQVVAYRDSLREEIASNRENLTRYRRLLDQAEDIRRQKTEVEKALAATDTYFVHLGENRTMGVVASDLQGRLGALTPGLDLKSSTARFRAREDQRRVGVRFSGTATLGTLSDFLYKVEAMREPLLFVDNLNLNARSRRNAKPEDDTDINMSVTVYALLLDHVAVAP